MGTIYKGKYHWEATLCLGRVPQALQGLKVRLKWIVVIFWCLMGELDIEPTINNHGIYQMGISWDTYGDSPSLIQDGAP